MTPAEADATLELLRGRPALADKVHDGVLPQRADGSVVADTYAVLYDADPIDYSDDRLTASQRLASRRDEVFTVRCVAETPTGVRDITSHVRAALIGKHLDVTGRACSSIELDSGDRRPSLDRTTTPHLWFVDQDFTFISLPA